MRIGLQTWGTEGDVAPFLALAGGLRQAGHAVTLLVTAIDDRDHGPRARELGIAFQQVGGPFGHGTDPYALTASHRPTWQLRALLRRFHEPFAAELLEAGDALCSDHDIVVGHMLNRTLHSAALTHGTPRVAVAFSPQAIPGSRPPLARSLGPLLDAALWRLGDAAMTHMFYPRSTQLHARRGLPTVRSLLNEVFRSPVLNLVAASPVLVPVPDDVPCTRVTGAWAGEAAGPPVDAAVLGFLASGPPPVYLTFGSCAAYAPQAAFDLLAGAARLAGVRAIVQVDGPLALSAPTRDLLVVSRTRHATVMPRCAMVVHHGGAGTVHAVARAGVPSVVVPHAFDQAWWADRLVALGTAASPLPRYQATPALLAERIRQTCADRVMAERAREVAHRMRGEDGVADAVQAIGALRPVGRPFSPVPRRGSSSR